MTLMDANDRLRAGTLEDDFDTPYSFKDEPRASDDGPLPFDGMPLSSDNKALALISAANNDTSQPANSDEEAAESIDSTFVPTATKCERDGANWLREEGPARRYLLRTMDQLKGSAVTESFGVMPAGEACMLAAGGGVGKTYVLIKLAICVATGRPWLNFLKVTEPGYVLLWLGEESDGEIRRRMYSIARQMDLSDAEVDMALKHVYPVPMRGKPVCLTQADETRKSRGDFGSTKETDFARDVRAYMTGIGHSWSLVIMDPLSRFAGPLVEIDNNAATAFVQELELFTALPGNPTLLISHHTNKASRTGATDAASARGSSALTDGVRWQANLTALPSNDEDEEMRLLEFAITKNNYGRALKPVTLIRDPEHFGAIRKATAEEVKRYTGKRDDAVIEQAVKKKQAAAKAKEAFEAKRQPDVEVQASTEDAPVTRTLVQGSLRHEDPDEQMGLAVQQYQDAIPEEGTWP